jgi:uncharacterized protein
MFKRVVCAGLLISVLMAAQEVARVTRKVRASGEATVTAKPDRAEVSIGVNTSAPTADAASAQNAKNSTQVLDALKQVLHGAGEIKTTGYSISPEYEYPQGGTPRLTGYRSSNTVLATVDDIGLVGKVLDTAAQSGANEVGGISFSLRDDSTVRNQALAEAARKARSSAEAIAKALNLRVTGIVEAESGVESAPPRPLPMMQKMGVAEARTTTPVEVGNLNVHANVVVTLGIE